MFKITEIPCNFPLNVNFSSQFPCEIYFLAFSLQELVFPCGKEKSLQVEALVRTYHFYYLTTMSNDFQLP